MKGATFVRPLLYQIASRKPQFQPLGDRVRPLRRYSINYAMTKNYFVIWVTHRSRASPSLEGQPSKAVRPHRPESPAWKAAAITRRARFAICNLNGRTGALRRRSRGGLPRMLMARGMTTPQLTRHPVHTENNLGPRVGPYEIASPGPRRGRWESVFAAISRRRLERRELNPYVVQVTNESRACNSRRANRISDPLAAEIGEAHAAEARRVMLIIGPSRLDVAGAFDAGINERANLLWGAAKRRADDSERIVSRVFDESHASNGTPARYSNSRPEPDR